MATVARYHGSTVLAVASYGGTRVVDMLVTLRERHRFLRGLRSWVGFKQMGIEYQRDARLAVLPARAHRERQLGLGARVGLEHDEAVC